LQDEEEMGYGCALKMRRGLEWEGGRKDECVVDVGGEHNKKERKVHDKGGRRGVQV
jgi:hypothetical protein